MFLSADLYKLSWLHFVGLFKKNQKSSSQKPLIQWNQVGLRGSLGGPLSRLCPTSLCSIQDGHLKIDISHFKCSNLSLSWMKISTAKVLFFTEYKFRGFWFTDIFAGIIFLCFFIPFWYRFPWKTLKKKILNRKAGNIIREFYYSQLNRQVWILHTYLRIQCNI